MFINFDNNKKRIHVSLFLISIMLNTDIEKNNYELKKYFSAQLKLNMRENNDISPLKLVFYLLILDFYIMNSIILIKRILNLLFQIIF